MIKYSFLTARSGDIVPTILQNGKELPLHSTIDPKKEASRLISTITKDTNFIILLGLGGGFAVQEILAATAAQILIIDFNHGSVKQLLSFRDYSFLNNKRCTFLIDPNETEIKNFLLTNYNPVLCGGIKVIPLRTRTDSDKEIFDKAAAIIKAAINEIAADYSVQAHFGHIWFSNIIRNIKTIQNIYDNQKHSLKKEHPAKAAIVAAGPSLDFQIEKIALCKSQGVFIISSDTALPALVHNGLVPDAVVSIDCQHISYHHFLGLNLNSNSGAIPLFLDIASPPLLSHFSGAPVFFSSKHPLALYISKYWRPFPFLDTSGGNVTYACLSLAQYLKAKHITVFGADFANVGSQSYAKGTYIYPVFDKKQNRLSPMEAQLSSFLYRSPFLPKKSQEQIYYETASLKFYRQKFEEKAGTMDAEIFVSPGMGAAINFPPKAQGIQRKESFTANEKESAEEFLRRYRKNILALPQINNFYVENLNEKERELFATLLPIMAFLKNKNPLLNVKDLTEETKIYCIGKIDKIIP